MREIVDIEMDLLLGGYLRNTLHDELIEGIEGKALDPQLLALGFHPLDLLVDTFEIFALNQLRHQAHQLVVGSGLLTIRGSIVMHQGMQLLHLTLYLLMMFLLFLSEIHLIILCSIGHLLILALRLVLQFVDAVVITVFLFQLLLIFLILTIHLVLQHQTFTEPVTLLF